MAKIEISVALKKQLNEKGELILDALTARTVINWIEMVEDSLRDYDKVLTTMDQIGRNLRGPRE